MKCLQVIFLVYLTTLPLLEQVAGHDYEVPAVSFIFLTCILWMQAIFIRKRIIRITQMDVAVFGLAVYALLNAIFAKEARMNELMCCKWAVAGIMYLLARSFGEIALKGLPAAMVVSGFIQSTVGLLQLAGALQSGHGSFSVTGSFHNPGPYGGYLAVTFIAGVYLLATGIVRNALRPVLVVTLMFISCMMIISDSRAAWLAAGITTGYLLYRYYSPVVARKSSIHRYWLPASLCLVTIASCLMLYYYKKGSADVRLTVWAASGQMIWDSPVIGHGAGSFAALYMNYQGRYFRNYPDSKFRNISDNRNQPFNEFIGIGCELGCIGLLLAGCMLYSAFSEKNSIGLKAMLTGLCVFAFFSYPFRIFPLYLFFPLIFGLCVTPVLLEWKMNRIFTILATTVSLFLVCQIIFTYRYYAAAYRQLEQEKPEVILTADTKYMSRYTRYLFDKGNYSTFIHAVKEKDFPFMTSELACDMGIAYICTGQKEKAEQILLSAYYMVPSRVLPKYLLFRLYKANGLKEKAMQKANEILRMDIKEIGSVYLKAQAEAKSFLNNNG
jgi:O-antigen ligase